MLVVFKKKTLQNNEVGKRYSQIAVDGITPCNEPFAPSWFSSHVVAGQDPGSEQGDAGHCLSDVYGQV